MLAFSNSLTLKKSKLISTDERHVLYNEFEALPSGRRFRAIPAKTNRRLNSLIPTAVRMLNNPNMLN